MTQGRTPQAYARHTWHTYVCAHLCAYVCALQDQMPGGGGTFPAAAAVGGPLFGGSVGPHPSSHQPPHAAAAAAAAAGLSGLRGGGGYGGGYGGGGGHGGDGAPPPSALTALGALTQLSALARLAGLGAGTAHQMRFKDDPGGWAALPEASPACAHALVPACVGGVQRAHARTCCPDLRGCVVALLEPAGMRRHSSGPLHPPNPSPYAGRARAA